MTELPEILTVKVEEIDGDHRCDGTYVRDWWMSQLGPTSTTLLQILASPAPGMTVQVLLTDLAFRLGIQPSKLKNRQQNPLLHAFDRLEKFGLIRVFENDHVAVRSHTRTLDDKMLRRFPLGVKAMHDAYITAAAS